VSPNWSHSAPASSVSLTSEAANPVGARTRRPSTRVPWRSRGRGWTGRSSARHDHRATSRDLRIIQDEIAVLPPADHEPGARHLDGDRRHRAREDRQPHPYRAVQRIGAVPHARQCSPTPNQESRWVLVREGGFEPPRPFGHRILSPARLPGSATLAAVKPKYRQGYSRVGYQGREPEA
jgi:hypothetical protein